MKTLANPIALLCLGAAIVAGLMGFLPVMALGSLLWVIVLITVSLKMPRPIHPSELSTHGRSQLKPLIAMNQELLTLAKHYASTPGAGVLKEPISSAARLLAGAESLALLRTELESLIRNRSGGPSIPSVDVKIQAIDSQIEKARNSLEQLLTEVRSSLSESMIDFAPSDSFEVALADVDTISQSMAEAQNLVRGTT